MSSFLREIKHCLKPIDKNNNSIEECNELLVSKKHDLQKTSEKVSVQKLPVGDNIQVEKHQRKNHQKHIISAQPKNLQQQQANSKQFRKIWNVQRDFSDLTYPTKIIELRIQEKRTLLKNYYKIFKNSIDERRQGDIEYLISSIPCEKDYTDPNLKIAKKLENFF